MYYIHIMCQGIQKGSSIFLPYAYHTKRSREEKLVYILVLQESEHTMFDMSSDFTSKFC